MLFCTQLHTQSFKYRRKRTVGLFFFFFFSMALQRQLHVEPSIASLSMASEGTRTGCSRSPFFFAGLPGLKHPVFATKENGKPWFFGQDSDL